MIEDMKWMDGWIKDVKVNVKERRFKYSHGVELIGRQKMVKKPVLEAHSAGCRKLTPFMMMMWRESHNGCAQL